MPRPEYLLRRLPGCLFILLVSLCIACRKAIHRESTMKLAWFHILNRRHKSTLCHRYPSRRSRVWCRWLRVDITRYTTFKQGVTNVSSARTWLSKKSNTSHCLLTCNIGYSVWYQIQTFDIKSTLCKRPHFWYLLTNQHRELQQSRW